MRAVRWLVCQVVSFFRWSASQGPVMLAFELMALSALIGSVTALIGAATNYADEGNEHANDRTLREQVARATFEQECRFDLSTPVNEIQAEKLDALALGLVAVTEDDEAALAEQVARIRELSRRGQEALAVRAEAVETCGQRARDRFG